MSERTWGLQVERCAKERGWIYYHTFNSKHSAGGYPDYHFIHRDRREEFYAELKTEKGKLTAKQIYWRDTLIEIGHEWHLWRPSDIDDVERRLGGEQELYEWEMPGRS